MRQWVCRLFRLGDQLEVLIRDDLTPLIPCSVWIQPPRHLVGEDCKRSVYPYEWVMPDIWGKSYGLVLETWTFYYSDGTSETVTKRTFEVL